MLSYGLDLEMAYDLDKTGPWFLGAGTQKAADRSPSDIGPRVEANLFNLPLPVGAGNLKSLFQVS